MLPPIKLTHEEISDLKELGNIGTGFAASRLANQIGVRCVVSLPEVFTLSESTMQERLGHHDDFSVAVDIRMRGDFDSTMFLLMTTQSADMVIDYMKRSSSMKSGTLVDLPREYALKKLGEDMIGGYSNAVNDFLKTTSHVLSPEMVIDLWSKALEKILGRIIKIDGEQILIQSHFSAPDQTFSGTFAYILNRASQHFVFNKLHMMTNTY